MRRARSADAQLLPGIALFHRPRGASRFSYSYNANELKLSGPQLAFGLVFRELAARAFPRPRFQRPGHPLHNLAGEPDQRRA